MREPPNDGTATLPPARRPEPPVGATLPAQSARTETLLPGTSTTEKAPTPEHDPKDSTTHETRPLVFAAGSKSLAEQIREATAAGEAWQLASAFGDAAPKLPGGWISILSADPFEILFLDPNQRDRITPEVVAAHHREIGAFWAQKVQSLHRGSRLLMAQRYGGEHGSAELVESYPRKLDAAFQQLRTDEDLSGAFAKRDREALEQVLVRVRELLDHYLVDGVLRPEETKRLLSIATSQHVPSTPVAVAIEAGITQRGLKPNGELLGATFEERLSSVTWSLEPLAATTATAVVAPPRRSETALKAIVFVVLLGAVAVGLYLYSSGARSLAAPGDTAPPAQTEVRTAPKEISSPTSNDPMPAPAPATSVVEAEAKERQRRREEEAWARAEAERKAADARQASAALAEQIDDTRTALQRGMQDVRELESRKVFDQARILLDTLVRSAAEFPEELDLEIKQLSQLSEELHQGEIDSVRRESCERQISGFQEALLDDKLTEVVSGARRLLDDSQQCPFEDLRKRVERIYQTADEDLQRRISKGAPPRDGRTKRVRPPNEGGKK